VGGKISCIGARGNYYNIFEFASKLIFSSTKNLKRKKMKKEISQIVEEYITSVNTDYAILINGEWGSGKTYFFKNSILREIEKLKAPNGENHKVIYVSLNGLKNLDEIYHQIVAEKYGFGKKAKIGYGIFKTLLKLGPKFVSDISPSDVAANFDIKDFLNLSSNILCFDDLERKSKDLDIAELLGFINTQFVEHNKVKVIFISNEKELIEQTSESDYNRIKEKLIGRSILFELEVKDTVSQIMDKNFTNRARSIEIFKNHQEYIIDLLIDFGLKNLRTIVSYLQTISNIFEKIEKEQITGKEKTIIFFTLIVLVEFKSGRIKTSDTYDFKGLDLIDERFHQRNLLANYYNSLKQKEDITKSYSQEFYDRYLRGRSSHFIFYPSIYLYILTGFFDREKFLKEIIPIDTMDVPIWLQKFSTLQLFHLLDDSVFKETIEEVLAFIEKGQYNLYFYPRIYDTFLYLIKNELIDVSVEDLKSKFLKAVDLSAAHTELDANSFAKIKRQYQVNVDFSFLLSRLEERHDEKFSENIKTEAFKLIESLDKDMKLIEECFNNTSGIPIFQYIDPEESIKRILSLHNKNIYPFIELLEKRYNSTNVGDYLFEDYENLEKFRDSLLKKIPDFTNEVVKHFNLNLLEKRIEFDLERLKSTRTKS
jgi:hypothetical protein